MGQVQSTTADGYSCRAGGLKSPRASGKHSRREMSRGVGGGRGNFRNSLNNSNKLDSNDDDYDDDGGAAASEERQRQHVRKLSNVSNRNVQLLSMKPRSDHHAYADGLRARRRSSLINLILGAPSSGPRFSDDLCSLSSHMSELHCNFGIDYFPDATSHQAFSNHYYTKTTTTAAPQSVASLATLDEIAPCTKGNYSIGGSHLNEQHQHHHNQHQLQYANFNGVRSSDGHSWDSRQQPTRHQHRRRSSLGSVSSFESAAAAAAASGLSGTGVTVATAVTAVKGHVQVVKSNPFNGISLDPSLNDKHTDANFKSLTSSNKKRQDTNAPQQQQHLPSSLRSSSKPGDYDQDETTEDKQLHRVDGSVVPPVDDNNQVSQLSTNRVGVSAGGVPGGENSSNQQQERQQFYRRRPSLSSIFLASIDLTSSLDCETCTDGRRNQPEQVESDHQRPNQLLDCGVTRRTRAPPLVKSNLTDYGASTTMASSTTSDSAHEQSGFSSSAQRLPPTCTTISLFGGDGGGGSASKTTVAADNGGGGGAGGLATGECINHHQQQANMRRMLHRSGSELSLYSSASASSSSGNMSHHQLFHHHHHHHHNHLSTFNSLPLNKRQSQQSNMFEQSCCCCSGCDVAGTGSLGKGVGVGRMGKKLAGHQLTSSAPVANGDQRTTALVRETKLIIMLQVCLPFILAGFGNMAAGLVLNKMSHWQAFRSVPMFFVLLPSFVGLKGNIEMTLASRLSTLANLHLLETGHQRRHAFASNLILILSQAIGLSMFAAFSSMLCEYLMGKLSSELGEIFKISLLVVLPCALITSMVLVILSSIIMWTSIWFANLIQVNPDNLSTLVAAMYGDVSCVLTYGLFAELMYSCHQRGILVWPLMIVSLAAVSWPALWYAAFKFKETHELSVSSMPPMLTGIVVSLGSGTVLSLVVGRFTRIALYQPVVNGFGANLIAVQASRVSTWLWCGALRRLSSTPQAAKELFGAATAVATAAAVRAGGPPSMAQIKPPKLSASLVSFGELSSAAGSTLHGHEFDDGSKTSDSRRTLLIGIGNSLLAVPKLALKLIKTLLWSFLNPSPNSVAARLLLLMLVPAHTLYFFVIWLLSPANYVIITWQFYVIYIGLCLTQVFILLTICEPLMTLLMRRHLDPDIFGISLLMALADLVGTLCLTGAFVFLASIGDPNAFR